MSSPPPVAEGNEAFAASAAEIKAKGRIVADLGARKIQIGWDYRLRAPRAHFAEGDNSPAAIIPMYWFAVCRHYSVVRTPADCRPCQM